MIPCNVLLSNKQKRVHHMKIFQKAISLIGLALVVIPAFLVFAGIIDWERHALLMLLGTLLWFGSAPFWMKDKKVASHAE